MSKLSFEINQTLHIFKARQLGRFYTLLFPQLSSIYCFCFLQVRFSSVDEENDENRPVSSTGVSGYGSINADTETLL